MQQLIAVGVSIGVEAGVVALAAKRLEGQRGRLALVAAGATLLTHPFAWQAALWGYRHAPVWAVVLAVEALVTLAEACAYRAAGELSWRRALLASLLANVVSTALGLLSWPLLRG
ncbi:MAG TPA: hypothetical protein DEA08_22685 [Planctomycetes bacterium]|nr:hypothetical protein [Planctomycetota bacterium]